MNIAENLGGVIQANYAMANTSTTPSGQEVSSSLKTDNENVFQFPLIDEILAADGLLSQDPTTGKEIEGNFGVSLNDGKKQIVASYTTNLFGLPFQLLDSVDARFKSVNENVGYEFLRTFIMHSPILHLSPGLPLFTGGARETETFVKHMISKNVGSRFKSDGNSTDWGNILISASKSFLKNKIQRRMFGIMYQYEDYMGYVNLLCRSVALLLKLVYSDGSSSNSTEYPNGIFANSKEDGKLKFQSFDKVDWGNYRYECNQKTYVERIEETEFFQKLWDNSKSGISKLLADINKEGSSLTGAYKAFTLAHDIGSEFLTNLTNQMTIFAERTRSVQFVVDPQGASENYTNDLKDSEITQVLSKANSIGSEVAFYTGANIDAGLVGPIMEAAGKLTTSVVEALKSSTTVITGGFAHNLISGALGALQGERIIFPKIYDKSQSNSSYSFKVNLASPYGDVYNYFVNIVVPYLHILALAAPREVSANASKTPFIVKAFIPGLCTCEMGMITSLRITKNPETQHISANGFPLSVSIDFDISELYNHMAISSEYDPYTFMFNETLMDYLCNLSGIYPTFNRLAYQSSLALEGWQSMASPTGATNDGKMDANMFTARILQQELKSNLLSNVKKMTNG